MFRRDEEGRVGRVRGDSTWPSRCFGNNLSLADDGANGSLDRHLLVRGS